MFKCKGSLKFSAFQIQKYNSFNDFSQRFFAGHLPKCLNFLGGQALTEWLRQSLSNILSPNEKSLQVKEKNYQI